MRRMTVLIAALSLVTTGCSAAQELPNPFDTADRTTANHDEDPSESEFEVTIHDGNSGDADADEADHDSQIAQGPCDSFTAATAHDTINNTTQAAFPTAPTQQIRLHNHYCTGRWVGASVSFDDRQAIPAVFEYNDDWTYWFLEGVPDHAVHERFCTTAPHGLQQWMSTNWPGSALYDCHNAAPSATSDSGDLGLTTPMTRPACDGSGIAVVYSATTPGRYANEVQNALNQHSGARYLRTDQACPSLRQSFNGNPIYAVYFPAGNTHAQICSTVRRLGGNAYGRWLDTTSDPAELIAC
ncbi:hypothetical protein IEU95_10220 [Hoyosella rhizosphaerae]|uniref:Uncharacterized protein n=1 Tax=Hoyosella rhizosphaerae TaxID=1755582 RepID=A0A916U074_9ACTN|nr:hypothetical protein [Hoyosella rhizosphaerae]MBN4927210.1 hypothetical protein [Hoyosella rhizosphaerae]GGC53130.1 hypothetical protein GCM10011410_01840 [Hoyosella rhizosphaerae]